MKPLSTFLFLVALPMAADTVRGRVTDATGAPLPGVSVATAASSSLTDARGAYAIEATYGEVITFRRVNFATIEKPAAKTVDATMALETSAEIVVTGKRTFRNLADLDAPVGDLFGIADAASVGVVTAQQIESRVAQRPADVLEAVPGLVISQHSGEGKANQYYLRGFNLDHGTDLAMTVAGAPVNMPSHAHGQGYSDANFLIPELISGVQYKKGPYYADTGDFASAGAVNVNYVNLLERPIVSLTGGPRGYHRALAAGSRATGDGMVLGAIEISRNDGPWSNPDDYRKLNALLRYTGGRGNSAYSVTLSTYDGGWNSTDQIPDRAVTAGVLHRFGAVDTTNGGSTHRHSLVAEWQRGGSRASGYVLDYGVNLFSNFTYFLDDPVNGDQFEQEDRRVVTGGRMTQQWLRGSTEFLAGADLRHDDITGLGLFRTRRRERIQTIRDDELRQTSLGTFVQTSTKWTERLRTVAGVRADTYRFDVASNGRAMATIVNPKLNVIVGPWRSTEFYASAGGGFHSNDGRRAPEKLVDPLARTWGAELGLRTTAIPRLHSTLAFWRLDIASELVFIGDAGTTEASRPSRRSGVEWVNYYRVTKHILFEADLAYSRARFRDGDTAGDRVPGAVEGVASIGLSLQDLGRVSGSVRYRHLGPRPLVEDDSVRSRSSQVITAEIGYTIVPRVRLVVEGLNLTNAKVSDIDYFYRSRLPGEPLAGVDDVHTHPMEPRAFRVRIETTF